MEKWGGWERGIRRARVPLGATTRSPRDPCSSWTDSHRTPTLLPLSCGRHGGRICMHLVAVGRSREILSCGRTRATGPDSATWTDSWRFLQCKWPGMCTIGRACTQVAGHVVCTLLVGAHVWIRIKVRVRGLGLGLGLGMCTLLGAHVWMELLTHCGRVHGHVGRLLPVAVRLARPLAVPVQLPVCARDEELDAKAGQDAATAWQALYVRRWRVLAVGEERPTRRAAQ